MVYSVVLLSFVIVSIQNTWEHSFMLVGFAVRLHVRN